MELEGKSSWGGEGGSKARCFAGEVRSRRRAWQGGGESGKALDGQAVEEDREAILLISG